MFRGLIVSGTQRGGRAPGTFCVNSVTVFSGTVLMAGGPCEHVPVTVR